MNRRTLLKGSLALGSGLLGTQIVGCTSPSALSPATTQPRQASTGPEASKVLLAYFSRAGENYYYGGRIDLEVGNTEVVANMIASTITADVYRIEAADPYPESYEATVERNKREQDDEARPAIAGRLPTVDTYDTVMLGSPIWNVRPPMIMRTFVDNVDLSGKKISSVRHLRRQRHGQHHRRLHPLLPRRHRSEKVSPFAAKRPKTPKTMSAPGYSGLGCSPEPDSTTSSDNARRTALPVAVANSPLVELAVGIARQFGVELDRARALIVGEIRPAVLR